MSFSIILGVDGRGIMETRRICRVIATVDIYVSILSLVSVSLVLSFMGIATYSGNQLSILDSQFGLTTSKGTGGGFDDLTKAVKPIFGLKFQNVSNGASKENTTIPFGSVIKLNSKDTNDQWLHNNVMVLATWMLTTLTFVGSILSLYAAIRLFRGVKRGIPRQKALKACRLWWNVNISLLMILVLDMPLGRVTGLVFSYIGLRALAVWLVNTYIKELSGESPAAEELGAEEEPKSGIKVWFGNAFEKLKASVGGFDKLKAGVDTEAFRNLENVDLEQGIGNLTENINVDQGFDKLKETVQDKALDKMQTKLEEIKEEKLKNAKDRKVETDKENIDTKQRY